MSYLLDISFNCRTVIVFIEKIIICMYDDVFLQFSFSKNLFNFILKQTEQPCTNYLTFIIVLFFPPYEDQFA